MARLASVKLGQTNLAGKINSQFQLDETINIVSNGNIFALTEGIVIYRKNTKSITETLNIYAQDSKSLSENLNIYFPNQYSLTESLAIKQENNFQLNESVGLFLPNQFVLTEAIDIYKWHYYVDKIGIEVEYTDENNNPQWYIEFIDSTFVETINILEPIRFDLIETIDIVYVDQTPELNESITIVYPSLKNIDEEITIIGQKSKSLLEDINITYNGVKSLSESIQVVKYHIGLSESINIKSLDLQGLYLYEDAQLTKLIDNDTISFIYSFGDTKEEERIVPFYILSARTREINNIYIGINYNQPLQQYGENMISLSPDGSNFTYNDIYLGTISPLQASVFYVKLLPLYGIDNGLQNLHFRIYKR